MWVNPARPWIMARARNRPVGVEVGCGVVLGEQRERCADGDHVRVEPAGALQVSPLSATRGKHPGQRSTPKPTDSLLRPVYGRAKQCASFGQTKILGKTVLRRGLSPLAVTTCTPIVASVLAGDPGVIALADSIPTPSREFRSSAAAP